MLRTNPHYARMGKSYLFAEIAHRVEAFRKAHPGTGVISMGIGDVTQPLVPSVIRRCTPPWTTWAVRTLSTATARNRDTPFCAKR